MLLSLFLVIGLNAQASCGELCGNYGAYHKDYLEELKKHNACLAPMVRCAKPKEQNINSMKVSCQNKLCVIDS